MSEVNITDVTEENDVYIVNDEKEAESTTMNPNEQDTEDTNDEMKAEGDETVNNKMLNTSSQKVVSLRLQKEIKHEIEQIESKNKLKQVTSGIGRSLSWTFDDFLKLRVEDVFTRYDTKVHSALISIQRVLKSMSDESRNGGIEDIIHAKTKPGVWDESWSTTKEDIMQIYTQNGKVYVKVTEKKVENTGAEVGVSAVVYITGWLKHCCNAMFHCCRSKTKQN